VMGQTCTTEGLLIATSSQAHITHKIRNACSVTQIEEQPA